MIGLGTLLAGLGAKLVTDVVAKTAAHDVVKKHSKLVVVYAKGGFVATRHFSDHSKAVEFQRQISAHGLPSFLMESTRDGRLNMEPVVTMNGLGSAWIRSNYALPKGPYSSAIVQQGKQGTGLVHANEVNAQAWADEMGPKEGEVPGDPRNQYNLPFYKRSYGSTYDYRPLPKDIYGPTFYDDGAGGDDYNLVNPHNT